MPRNGSGSYSLPEAAFVNGTVISETAVNSDFSDIAAQLTNSVATDGQTTMSGDLKLGGNKISGGAVGTAATDAATLGQTQAEAFVYGGTAGGTADALTITLSPAITAYATGQRFVFLSSASPNTGATTVAVNGLATKAVETRGAALSAGDIPATQLCQIVYDGTAFQLSQISIPAATVSAIPATTAMLFYQNAAPTGWTIDATNNDKALRVVSSSGGVTGGTTAWSTAFDHGHSDTLSGGSANSSNVISHSHTVARTTGQTAGTSHLKIEGNTATTGTLTTSSTSSGSGHTHTVSGSVTATTSIDPQYLDVIVCTKDA